MARELSPAGRLITLEIDAHHAEVARANIEGAGLAEVVDIRLGPALSTLAAMAKEPVEPFDLIFIDADKRNNPGYLQYALQFSRPGTVIVVDNVVRDGRVIDESSQDPDLQGTRKVLAALAADKTVISTALQTVGHKGYDGFAIAYVRR
jgi:predicted O-methyltransferase YrrM